jgi:hypothetical protein
MNAPSPARFPWNTLWLTLAGIFFGGLAAVFIRTVDKPFFESTAVCRLSRPATDTSGVSYREWLNTEAVAMGSEENLRRVTRNLNLAAEWHRGELECVDVLKERLEFSAVPGTEIIRVTARGPKATECAALVNGVLDARKDSVQDAQKYVQNFENEERSYWVKTLTSSCTNKRAELLAGVKSLNLPTDNVSDKALMDLTLPKPLDLLRRDWFAETARLEQATRESKTTAISLAPMRYAEILEHGRPSVNPVEISWAPRAASWSLMGGALGLGIGILLGFLCRRSPAGPSNLQSSPQQLAAFEY